MAIAARPKRPAAEKDRRDVTINVRSSTQVRDLIDRAAMALGKTRSEFILETACDRAKGVLLDQTVFGLDDDAYDAFLKLLDRPAPAGGKLRRLLAGPPPWERPSR